jgi:pyruvate formate lyase activating enzyme
MEEYLKTKGRIFDIQRYSIHDGNGIRTIVFLKGCVLRCRWCCNPESQHYEIETMMVQGEPKVIGEDTTVAEVMKTVEKDRTYYRRTGGGLTLSGGESLCQPKFARDLLRAAKELGITTAMESMGCAPYSTIEEILPYLDQWFCISIGNISCKCVNFRNIISKLRHCIDQLEDSLAVCLHLF